VLVLILILLCLGFGVSLLPFLVPGSIYAMFGLVPNRWLGNLVGDVLGLGHGTLVTTGGVSELTLPGVLVVYILPILAIVFILRGR
jgi:hypothetical protein